MILSLKPLSLAEVKELAGDLEEKPELKDYLKKFATIKKEDAEKLREDLKSIGNHKLREDAIVKIIDLLPKDAEALSKIFTEISLDEKETNEVLEIVKKY